MRPASLDQVIRDHAVRIGGRTALACVGRSGVEVVTWRELDEATARLAARLRDLAAVRAPSCLVVSLVENDLREALALIACLRVDAPILVVSGRQLETMRHAVLEEVRRSGYSLVTVASESPEVLNADRVEPAGAPRSFIDAGCLLLASGGSTGRPKLIVDRGIRATPARPAAIRPFLATGWHPGQRQLVCSPLYHAAGLTPFVEGLASGNASYFLSVFDGRRVGDIVERFRVDWLQMTPFHMSAVLAGDRRPGAWGRTPRLVHMADHCPPRIKRSFHEALGPANVYEMYTASEGIGMTMARGDEWDERPGTVGRGYLTALRVADGDGEPVGPHVIGEVYMRSGARTARSYLTAAGRLRVSPDGFATLGDVGHLDEDGYLYLRPRQISTISVAGVTVSPTEVEAELMEHPRIADVGVCSNISGQLGERVVAVVVPSAGELTESDVRGWARARLSAAQVPTRYVFTSALPRRDTGKLDRDALFALVNGTNADQWGKAERTCGNP